MKVVLVRVYDPKEDRFYAKKIFNLAIAKLFGAEFYNVISGVTKVSLADMKKHLESVERNIITNRKKYSHIENIEKFQHELSDLLFKYSTFNKNCIVDLTVYNIHDGYCW